MKQRTILVIDDEEFIQLTLKSIFENEDYKIIIESNGTGALKRIEKEKVDLVFLDLNLPDMNGLDVLKKIKKRQPGLLVIIMTGYASVESAVQSIKLGAYDYIKKPFKADVIKLITKLGFETLELKKKVQALEAEKISRESIDEILGSSEKILKVKRQIVEFAKYDEETVLITGESGVGKELAAKAIHKLSPRNGKEFVEINCASIPDNLLESELFGYEQGAFTDAKRRKIGIFEKAEGGTIFLDEIGEMSLQLQAKLLRVLEDKKFRRLGSTKDIGLNIRIIAATNKDLKEAIEKKEFREDLYYRLDVLRISIPPLRKRGEDVLILAKFFLDFYNKKFEKNIKGFTEEARKFLLSYDWPGNVRELKNLIARVSILTTSEFIELSDFPAELLKNKTELNCLEEAEEILLGKESLDDILGNFEEKIIKNALKKSNFNVSKTAQLLKIPRETLRYKIKKYGLAE